MRPFQRCTTRPQQTRKNTPNSHFPQKGPKFHQILTQKCPSITQFWLDFKNFGLSLVLSTRRTYCNHKKSKKINSKFDPKWWQKLPTLEADLEVKEAEFDQNLSDQNCRPSSSEQKMARPQSRSSISLGGRVQNILT